ncbi:hypothetical protein C8J57DRAFT_1249284 [Mycena rebaudengoi]|nr:hypothetical protein C8J57DRAFT_1249284 [Mycena rebaudengoi]
MTLQLSKILFILAVNTRHGRPFLLYAQHLQLPSVHSPFAAHLNAAILGQDNHLQPTSLSPEHFIINGGSFTSSTNHLTTYSNADAPGVDFRTVPLGDINVQHEIETKPRAVTRRRRAGLGSTRRMYAVRIPANGQATDMTVAIYQGLHAEEVNEKSHLEASDVLLLVLALGVAARNAVARVHVQFLPSKKFYYFPTFM